MTFFDEQKSIVENAALFSAPLLLIIGIIGLKQLNIARKSLKITSVRDAAKFSFQITEDYDEKFEKAYQALLTSLRKYNIEKFDGIITDFSIEEYHKLDENWRTQWEENEHNIDWHLTKVANLLEGYAIPFIKKIADEDIAFNIDCYVYIQLTTLCYPYIVKKHNDDKLNLHSCNTIELFLRWKMRIENLHNEKELLNAKEKIKRQEKIIPIKPIGS
jgi:hypothetical protein